METSRAAAKASHKGAPIFGAGYVGMPSLYQISAGVRVRPATIEIVSSLPLGPPHARRPELEIRTVDFFGDVSGPAFFADRLGDFCRPTWHPRRPASCQVFRSPALIFKVVRIAWAQGNMEVEIRAQMLREDEAELSPAGVLDAVARSEKVAVRVVECRSNDSDFSPQGQFPVGVQGQTPVAAAIIYPGKKCSPHAPSLLTVMHLLRVDRNECCGEDGIAGHADTLCSA